MKKAQKNYKNPRVILVRFEEYFFFAKKFIENKLLNALSKYLHEYFVFFFYFFNLVYICLKTSYHFIYLMSLSLSGLIYL